MLPPGGGSSYVKPRILRHLSLKSLTNFDKNTLNRIFRTIYLEWYFRTRNFNADLMKLAQKVISGTKNIYKTEMLELLLTPSKSHYMFNLRDFAKVVFGVCLSEREKVQSADQLVRLQAHDTYRVIGDRLISHEDCMFLLKQLRKVVTCVYAL